MLRVPDRNTCLCSMDSGSIFARAQRSKAEQIGLHLFNRPTPKIVDIFHLFVGMNANSASGLQI